MTETAAAKTPKAKKPAAKPSHPTYKAMIQVISQQKIVKAKILNFSFRFCLGRSRRFEGTERIKPTSYP